MKTCFKCGIEKPLSEFYKHPMMTDGHLGKCKKCAKIDVTVNRHKRAYQYAEYEKKRYKRPERKVQALASQRKRRKLHPEKYRVHQIVCRALASGKLVKQSCEICGATDNIQAHHDDYSKPLDVHWACFACHRTHFHGQTVRCDARRAVIEKQTK